MSASPAIEARIARGRLRAASRCSPGSASPSAPGRSSRSSGRAGRARRPCCAPCSACCPPAAAACAWRAGSWSGAAEETRAAVLRDLGVAFQSGALFDSLTLAENVLVPIRARTDLPASTAALLARVTLATVGPRGRRRLLPSQISGGMRKRAGIARAMALDPKILVLDEPTSGLDPLTAADLDHLIATLNRGLGITVVMVTHDLASTFAVAHRCILDRRGACGGSSPRAPRPSCAPSHPNPKVRAFFERTTPRRERMATEANKLKVGAFLIAGFLPSAPRWSGSGPPTSSRTARATSPTSTRASTAWTSARRSSTGACRSGASPRSGSHPTASWCEVTMELDRDFRVEPGAAGERRHLRDHRGERHRHRLRAAGAPGRRSSPSPRRSATSPRSRSRMTSFTGALVDIAAGLRGSRPPGPRRGVPRRGRRGARAARGARDRPGAAPGSPRAADALEALTRKATALAEDPRLSGTLDRLVDTAERMQGAARSAQGARRRPARRADARRTPGRPPRPCGSPRRRSGRRSRR